MAQVQTKTYLRMIPTAGQKFVHIAYFLKMNITKAISAMKQKALIWSYKHSTRSPFSISIGDALDRNSVRVGSPTGFRRLLPLQ